LFLASQPSQLFLVGRVNKEKHFGTAVAVIPYKTGTQFTKHRKMFVTFLVKSSHLLRNFVINQQVTMSQVCRKNFVSKFWKLILQVCNSLTILSYLKTSTGVLKK